MTIYEKAAESVGLVYIEAHETQICGAAVWDAIYACPQCDGTNIEEFIDPISVPCSYEHVQLVNPHSGEERWCKPDMAEWRCRKFYRCTPENPRGHVNCGWKPVPYVPPTETVGGDRATDGTSVTQEGNNE